MQEIWKQKHTKNREMDSSVRKHVRCRTHACAHAVPRDNTAVLTQMRLRLACIFLYLTDNSRVTPTVPFICFHNTLEMWPKQTEDPLQLCSSSKPPFSYGCLQILIKLRQSLQIIPSPPFLQTTSVSWHAATQPCYEVMCWTQWPGSWFYLAFWNFIGAFIYFIPKHSFRRDDQVCVQDL